jgi:hypothetical protein
MDDRVDPEICDRGGYCIRRRDLDFLGITGVDLAAWVKRRSVLGTTPELFQRMVTDLRDAVVACDVHPVDVRIQGSAAKFFAGLHKSFPHFEDDWLVEFEIGWQRSPADDELEEVARRHAAWFSDGLWPLQRPFDALFRLGLHRDRSDIDVQLSGGRLQDRIADTWRQLNADDGVGELWHQKYGFLDKTATEYACPELVEWGEYYTDVTDRLVAIACFGSEGPHENASEPSCHFRDGDWVVDLERAS